MINLWIEPHRAFKANLYNVKFYGQGGCGMRNTPAKLHIFGRIYSTYRDSKNIQNGHYFTGTNKLVRGGRF